MKLYKTITLISTTVFSFLSAHEEPWTAARPDGHAPISVMGDHMHKMGEWMLSYRYMTMEMEGLMKESSSITKAEGAALYPASMMGNMLPKDMIMDMHMLGTMYAISNKWTLLGMLNYLDNEMSMQNGNKMESSGLGDLKLGGLYDLAQWEHGRRMHLTLSLSLPVGSIDEKHTDGTTLGYGMQLGSGTFDFHPAITYLGQSENYSYGAQVGATLRIDENDQNYSLGNKFVTTLWGARKITDSLSASVKLDYSSEDQVDGLHRGLTMINMTPAKQATSQGRDLTTVGLGLNYYFENGDLSGHRLAAEWETPVDQKVNGVQLELDSVWTLGWQYAW